MENNQNKQSKNLSTMKKNASAEAAAEAAAKKQDTNAFTEDNLELHRLSFRERAKIRRERFLQNMEGMSKKEKISYFLYYYKWKIIFGVLIIALALAIPITLYRSSRPVVLSYAVINCHYPGNISHAPFDAYMDFYGYTKKQQMISGNYSYLNQATYEDDYAANPNSANFTSLPMLCYNGYYDIILTDRTGLEYCAAQSLIQPLDAALLPDVRSAVSSQASRIVSAAAYNGELREYGIDISDTAFASSLNLGYSDVYVGFIGCNDRNFKNARLFLNYVLELKLEP